MGTCQLSGNALFACKTLKDFTTLPAARRIHNVSTFLVESAFFWIVCKSGLRTMKVIADQNLENR